MPRSLFRKEAIDAQRQKFLGEASIAQPVRLWVYTTVALIIAALVIAYAIWGQYTRRERVPGYLSNAIGTAVVRMPDAGTVKALFVKEGQAVEKGAKLAELAVDKGGGDERREYERAKGEIEARARLAENGAAQAAQSGAQQVDQARKRVSNLQEEIRQVLSEIRLQTERLGTSQKSLDKWIELQKQGFASDVYLYQYQKEVKDQEIAVQKLQRQRAAIDKDLASAQSEIPVIELRTRAQVDEFSRQLSQAHSDAAELEFRHGAMSRTIEIAAPFDGVVTNVAPVQGQTVAADAAFATLLPKDSSLQAELLVPTRAIGFVHSGQRVLMRYEAFPYERFGQYAGTVKSVAKTPLIPGDNVGPIAIKEPVYRIVVTLDRQGIDANGEVLPLRSGMVLGADLLMEKRSLLEWLFLPAIQFFERTRSAA